MHSGQDFVYEFVAPTAGTYLYHSHVGLQLDRGLYGLLIIESAQEAGLYDQDVVMVLDDWLDGLPGTPDDAMKKLIAGGDRMMGGMSGMSSMQMPPDLTYPAYLINGKPADVLNAQGGSRPCCATCRYSRSGAAHVTEWRYGTIYLENQ